MKKFLIEISIAIVMISLGCIICVFEFKDYRFVNAYADMVEDNYQTYETTANKDNPLRIEMEDDMIDVEYVFDDTLEDEVIIQVGENIKHKFSKNKLRISEYSWHSISLGTYLEAWIDGLKDEKIYYFNRYNSYRQEDVVITCHSDTQKYMEMIRH